MKLSKAGATFHSGRANCAFGRNLSLTLTFLFLRLRVKRKQSFVLLLLEKILFSHESSFHLEHQFFSAQFLQFQINSSHQKNDAQDEVDSWENSIFSRKRRTKDCFLLTHNLKSKKVSVRDKFLPDAQFAPPL